MMQGIAILGSTGSIGSQTLEVVDNFPDKLSVASLVAGTNIILLAKQIHKYQPKIAVIAEKSLLPDLKSLVGNTSTLLLSGHEGIKEAIGLPEATTVLAAISGAAGLKPVLYAIDSGKKIALANKETLVSAGHLVMELSAKRNVNILPVDSEHSAIFQCISNGRSQIDSVILTASGGPFRGWSSGQLKDVTPQMALNHPTWAMGSKITIDSATLINKGLEVIEAHWLFEMPYNKIEVVVHPQSIIHSMVRFKDTSIMAQMGYPDMRLPILYALSWPEKWKTNWAKLDFTALSGLTFEKPDLNAFPGLRLAYEAGAAGGIASTVFNAANEAAVNSFLNNEITFNQITELIELSLQDISPNKNPSLEEIIEADYLARKIVESRVRTGYL